jgi:dTDP-4-dehydrorhamnose reductase
MTRLLITGASGLLGANLVLAAHEEHEVIAVYHRHPIELEGVQSVSADLSQPAIAKELFDRFQPDWVVHGAAATDVDACEDDSDMAFRLNSTMAGYVATAAADTQARLIHISTDAVFDGGAWHYSESDPTEPVNTYGRSKLEGEKTVTQAHPQSIIVRTNIFGWNAQQKFSLAEWFLDRLEKGINTPGFSNVFFSPILVNDLINRLFQLLKTTHSGIIHLAGADCISKYEFGRELAVIFRLDPNLVDRVSSENAGLKAPRAERLCLRSENIAHVFYSHPVGIREGLHRLKTLREEGYNNRLRSMVRSNDR